LVFDLKLGDGSHVCIATFCIRSGLLQNLVYKVMKDIQAGIVADDPLRGGAAARHDTESPQRSMVYFVFLST